MAEARVGHRAIRLTNLFRCSGDRSLVLGECFGTPPGSHQPIVYEPIERALAHPMGRGEGSVSDDLYALGVTLLGLFRGQTPLSEYDDRQILEAKLAKGSFTILTGGHWMPQELAEAIRGLLRDDPAERWDLVQAEAWLTGRRRHPVVHQKEVRVELPFRFKGVMHYSPRTLAVALNENWKTGAVDVARSGKLQIWATRGLQDQPTAEALGEVGQSKIGPRVVDDDLLLARTLIALDPRAPIRYAGFAVMPDGFAAAFALAGEDQLAARALVAIFQGQLPAYWGRMQKDRENSLPGSQDSIMNVGRYLSQTAAGFHLERCLYELNPLFPCRGALVADAFATDVQGALLALDAAGGKVAQGDRHFLAFLAARLQVGADKSLAKISQASGPADQILAHLRLLAEAQERGGPAKLSTLCKVFVGHLSPVVLSYRNRPLRERVQQALERVAADGWLPRLLDVVDQSTQRRADGIGYRAACARHRSLKLAIQRLRNTEDRRLAVASKLGHRLAAYVSLLISTVVIGVMFLFNTG